MRLKEGFILREIAGQTFVIATGEAGKVFHGTIQLNSTGRFIWKELENGLSENEIARKLARKYKIDVQRAEKDTKRLIRQMNRNGFFKEDEETYEIEQI